ncbi:MAG: hypothetical protein WAU32_15525 [Thermoanaerobaculia bacterium]
MKAGCRDLEKALRGNAPELFAAFEEHAESCPACGRELEEWTQISGGAAALKKRWAAPGLWPAIHQALAEQSQRRPETPEAGTSVYRLWARLLPGIAIASLFVIATAGLWVFRNSRGREPLTQWQTTKNPLLTERAVDEVETAERQYLASIQKLSRLAEPRLASARSPVMLNYREKLALLDSAIADLRSGIEQNRFNTHLRRELLAMYREKQQTLQNLMKEVQS